ncbi:MAG TPA: hypothetical protein PLG59_19105 [bacterium]|nr:hypothetical protein [bacterium]HQO36779.1 hypothetical protein [bacterium]HQQ00497.1 hypothetical protein [bacterium]
MRWLAAALGIMALILWIPFTKVSGEAQFFPTLLAFLRDSLGILTFSMAALASLVLAFSAAHTAREKQSWASTEERIVFWGALYLSLVFLVSALQFVIVGRWNLVHPAIYLVLKFLLFLGVLIYLVYSLWEYRKTRKLHSAEPAVRKEGEEHHGP